MSEEPTVPSPPPSPDATRLVGAPTPASEAPRQLGPYRLVRRLGGGGMGEIYLADQVSVGRRVAVKVLPTGALSNPDLLSRFDREVRVLAQLSHPHICPVLEAGVEGDTHYYAMEYVRGPNLARVLKTQRVDARRAAEIARQVAQALHFAHEHGIIHRDVKPLNVMLVRGERREDGARPRRASSHGIADAVRRMLGGAPRPDSTPALRPDTSLDAAAESDPEMRMPSPEYRDHAYLIDFGLACDVSAESRLTLSGEVMGTPAYMSPEQAAGDLARIGPATDVWALGVALYEMLTLRLPFGGHSPAEVLHAVVHADPARPRDLQPLVDRDIETIVLKAMEKDPSRRYASAAAIAEDLGRWLEGKAIEARPASLAYRVRKRIARNKAASASLAGALAVGALFAWMSFGPGTLRVRSNVAGVTWRVDGSVLAGETSRVWPPGEVTVRAEKEGYLPFERRIRVRGRATEEVTAELTPAFGWLSVFTRPPGATVLCDDEPIGTTPLLAARVPQGRRVVRVSLAGHEAVTEALVVRPSDRRPAEWTPSAPGEAARDLPNDQTVLERALRHEQGFLSITSDPAEVAVDLVPSAGGAAIAAASPADRLPLDTGRWRVRAHALNRFPREFDLEVRAGEEVRRRVTLDAMEKWEFSSIRGTFVQGVACDVDRDGLPDLLALWNDPGRMAAFSGETGRLLWLVELPGRGACSMVSFTVADLDGDLRPEVVVNGGWDEIRVYNAATGVPLAPIPTPVPGFVAVAPDLSGDALPDLLCTMERSPAVAALEGRTGKVLWSAVVPGLSSVMTARLREGPVPDVIGTGEAGVAALDGRTGRVLWRRQLRVSSPSNAADVDGDGLDDVLLATGWDQQAFHALSGRDGHDLWSVPVNMTLRPAFAIGDVDGDGADDVLAGGSDGGPLLVLSAATGRQEAAIEAIQTTWGEAALSDLDGDGVDDILAPSMDTLVAYSVKRHAVLWEYHAGDLIQCHPLLADLDGDGRLDVATITVTGRIAVLAATEPPVRWRQAGSSYNAEAVWPIEGPPRGILVGTPRLAVLDPEDGRVLAASADVGCEGMRVLGETGGRALVYAWPNGACIEVPGFRTVWRSTAPGFSAFGPCNGDGTADVVFAVSRSRLRALDGATGVRLWDRPEPADWLESWRPGQGAVVAGAACGAAEDGVRALDVRTGADLWRFRTEGIPVNSLTACGDDVLAATEGGLLYRLRAQPHGNGPLVWSLRLPGQPTQEGISTAGARAVGITREGVAFAVDVEKGVECWRTPLPCGSEGGVGLADLDGDGVAEAAATTSEGRVWVLRGSDGEVLWRAKVCDSIAWVRPTWSDLDGDGRPELLVPCRDNCVYALTVQPSAAPVTFAPGTCPFTPRAIRAETLRQDACRRAEEWRRGGKWGRLVEAARAADAPAAVCYAGALAARTQDPSRVLELADRARALGCRRLDLAVVRAEALPEPEQGGAMTQALRDASSEELEGAAPGPLWPKAAEELERDARTAGDWARVLEVRARTGPWESVERDFASASAAEGANLPRLRLVRARAAIGFDRAEEARADLEALAREADSASDARHALDGLDAQARESARKAGEAYAQGRAAEAIALATEATRIAPGVAGYWNDLAWFIATAPGAKVEEGQRAVVAARRALDLLQRGGAAAEGDMALYLDTLAAAQFAAGEAREALSTQQRALALPVPAALVEELRTRLKKYEDAAGAGR